MGFLAFGFTTLLTAVGVVGAPAIAQAATPPPSFVGEQLSDLSRLDTRSSSITCNADGSGQATWHVTGSAYGP